MKVHKIKFIKNKLLKFYLIQNQIYINNFKIFEFNNSLTGNLEHIELYFKKALRIIYEYHINNRKILFINFYKFNSLFFFEILKSTKHYYIPEKIWINGVINNRHSILRFLYKKLFNINKKILSLKNIKILLNIKTKPDLIVIFNSNFDKDLIKEFYNLDIPIIQFNSNIYFDKKSLYKIPGNFNLVKNSRIPIRDFLLYAILKKPLKKKLKIKKYFTKKSRNKKNFRK